METNYKQALPRPEQKDISKIQFRFRQRKFEEGNPSRKYAEPTDKINSKEWLQIKDADLFKQLFPPYLHSIAMTMDEWWIFVRKNYYKLVDNKELFELKKYLMNKYKDSIKDAIDIHGDVTRKQVETSFTYYEVLDLLKLVEHKTSEELDKIYREEFSKKDSATVKKEEKKIEIEDDDEEETKINKPTVTQNKPLNNSGFDKNRKG